MFVTQLSNFKRVKRDLVHGVSATFRLRNFRDIMFKFLWLETHDNLTFTAALNSLNSHS